MVARTVTSFILRYKNQFWLLVSLTAAFALRAYRLDAQSLWNDEGTSVALAPLSLSAIVDAAAKDIHPPLYYFLLHFWIPFGGVSEFAVRFLSVLAGVLVVALTFRLARLFFDREIAIIAAFLSAFSPFQVYYSQETRMYIWVTLFAAVSVFAMVRLLAAIEEQPTSLRLRNRSQVVSGLAYMVATLAMLYTQYVGAFVVLAENVAVLVWLAQRWARRASEGQDLAPSAATRRALFLWIALQIGVGLGFAPWYYLAGNQLASWPAISEPMDLPTLIWQVLNVYSVGLSLDPSSAFLVAIAFGILVAFGVRRAGERWIDWGVVVICLWLAIPLAAMYIISLSRPAYNPKLLLLATPPFFILAGRGLSTIHPGIFLHYRHPTVEWRPFRFFFFAIAVIATVGFIPSLENYYFDPRYARDDYRGIIHSIQANSRAGDGILVDDKGQLDVVRYYARGNHMLFALPRMRPAEPLATAQDVDNMLDQVHRLFAVLYATEQGDPLGIVEARLADHAFKARDEWHGNVRLAVYGVAPSVRPAPQRANARFGDDIALESYRLDVRDASPGDVLTLTLYWRAERVPSGRYKVFVHLLDRMGAVAAQRDGEPVADRRITTTWKPGEDIVDNYGIWIDAPLAAGEYSVEMGMYRVDDGSRLAITGSGGAPEGDRLILGTVRVNSPTSEVQN